MLQAVVECVIADLQKRNSVRQSQSLVMKWETTAEIDEKLVVQLLCGLIDSDNELECVSTTGLTLRKELS